MPNWANVYDEFIAGLFLSLFLALITIIVKMTSKFSFRNYAISVAMSAITQCARNNKVQYRKALKEMDERIQKRKNAGL